MNVEVYKRALLDLRNTFSEREWSDVIAAREQILDTPADAGDASVSDESVSEDVAEAEFESVTVEDIDAALRRIEDGTYGRCLVDGRPITPQRLEAVPWAAYCLKHQTLLEPRSPRKPTL